MSPIREFLKQVRLIPRTRLDVAFIFYYGLRVFVGLAALLFLIGADWATAFYTTLIFLLMVTPSLLKRQYRFYYPFEIDFAVAVFVFVNVYLGYIADFYNIYRWWDVFVHFSSGMLVGVVGFLLVYLLNSHTKTKINLTPSFVALFSFSFSMAVGGLWEIIEFGLDAIQNARLMQDGLNDTMGDLIVTAVGALIVASAGYIWMHSRENIPFTPAIFKRLQYGGKKALPPVPKV